MRIVRDTDQFHRELTRSGDGKVPVLQRRGLAAFGPTAYILTGNNTPKFGGGQSAHGFVIADGRTVGSIAVEASAVRQDKLQLS